MTPTSPTSPTSPNPSASLTPGRKFRDALAAEKPLVIPGATNALCAMLAERAGFRAVYLSGGGVAACMGMPDLAATDLRDVTIDAGRITSAVDIPLLVDADTGFGPSWLNIARTARELCRVGAAAMHLEDQQAVKRCGHRPNKNLVSAKEMCDRIRAAADARTVSDFCIMARTDALANEPREAAVARAAQYVEAGADMVFAEAAKTLDDYRAFKKECGVPVLANITEFGQTPMFSAKDLAEAEVDMMLLPLSAFRAMNRAAENVYRVVREAGTQRGAVEAMQTRDELYDLLGYRAVEEKMDALFGAHENKGEAS